ncbi:MAG: deoxyribodipyrimidine photolyase [Planctomycetota bacterium]
MSALELESPVPAARLRDLNAAPLRPERDYVLYWMTAARRTRWSHALDHALAACRALGRPLLILEALRCGHLHAAARFHSFVVEGMRDQQARCARLAAVRYYPYLEPSPGAGKGLLAALAERACLVVGDDYPCFFLPRMLAAAGARLDVRLAAVDGLGLSPLRGGTRVFSRAHALRRVHQKELLGHLEQGPAPDPLRGGLRGLPPAPELPESVLRRWPATDLAAPQIADLPIAQGIGPVAGVTGGERAARAALGRFLAARVEHYGEGRNHPDDECASLLSPWLHWGQLGAHEVFWALAEREGWDPGKVSGPIKGQKEGYWGMSPGAEAFLDQLATWRELGAINCARGGDCESYSGVPAWAQETLAQHQRDPRERLYSLEELEGARTADPLWNAAQRQLRAEGRIHNYLRMLWGKLAIAWSRDPQEAFERLVLLNDRYALDGRDPNSYSGIAWVFGRYDRAWGPERPIYGKVRYMTSDSARKKLRLEDYLARWSR